MDEKGRVGLVPTVMNRISDRCGAIPLEGKVISYFSAREQDFVNIGQYPLDRDYVVHPDDIICLTPPLSSNEPVSSSERPMMNESLAIKAQGSLEANVGKCQSPRVTSNGIYVLDYEQVSENASEAEDDDAPRIPFKDCRASFRKSTGRINIHCSVVQPTKDSPNVLFE